MPSDASKYREAVTDRLDDELSHWQSSLDHLRLSLLEEGVQPSLEAGLEHLETELLNAKHQWQRMKDAPAPAWGCERQALVATLSRIQQSLYELQTRRRSVDS